MVELNRFLTDEQAAYLAQLYTGTEVPKLHGTELLEDKVRSLRTASVRIACRCAKWWYKADKRGQTIHRLERTIRNRNKTIGGLEGERDRMERFAFKFRDCACDRFHDYRMEQERTRELGRTIHKLERKLHKANRKHAALHRAMHEDSRNLRQSLIKAVERLAQSIAAPDPVVENAHGAIWPRFEDGAPVIIGDTVKGVMCDVRVASIVFRHDCVLLYDSQMFHYVKLDGGERAQRPDGTRLALD